MEVSGTSMYKVMMICFNAFTTTDDFSNINVSVNFYTCLQIFTNSSDYRLNFNCEIVM